MTETIEQLEERLRIARLTEMRRPLHERGDLIGRLERCALRAEDIAAHAHQALDAACAPAGAHGADDLVAILQIAADIRATARRRP